MAVLGANQYGKAESRVVRIVRGADRHEIHDLNVSTSLRGDFDAAHVDGDQSAVLPTDTQKNTAFAYAKLHGVTSPEDYALALGRRLLEATPAAASAQVRVEQYAWDRLGRHAFARRGGEVRTCVVEVGRETVQVTSGLQDLVLLKSTGSEFKGFLVDEFTTLAEADDRILATSLTAQWRHDPASRRTGTRPTTWCATCCCRPSPRRTRGRCRRRSTSWARPWWTRCRASRRSGSRRRTSTTSWSTSRASTSTGWRTTARCSSPPTGRTA